MSIKRKALRQREWIILVRPYYLSKSGSRIWYTGVPKAGIRTDLGDTNASYDTATALKGVGEGMETGSKMDYDKGGWTIWYKTNSFVKLREKYRELLDVAGADNVRVVEMLPVDILVTPLS